MPSKPVLAAASQAPDPALDTVNECLWRGDERIALTPRAYALLAYLAERPGRLVTKDELLDAVWAGTIVTDGVLKVCVRELRIALRDDARAPRWIETHHRRGYALVRALARREAASLEQPIASTSAPAPQGHWVGREAELAELRRALDRALAGERVTTFVLGAAGIGKTMLVETFLREVETSGRALVARGQCLESFGAGEAYLPVLDALGRLGRGEQRERITGWLARWAPTWLVQLPALSAAHERETLAREVLGATRERMLREMAEALEALTQDRALVLLLEDMHWSDASTVELVASLARRRERARLLVLVTYRPVDVLATQHPLKALKLDLSSRKLASEIVLDDFGVETVRQYLAARFPGHALPESAAARIHARTQGHPLFLVHVVDWLVDQGVFAPSAGAKGQAARMALAGDLDALERDVPRGIREILELQLSRLDETQRRTLEAAAVAGVEFPCAAVAAGLECDTVEVEERCDELARRAQFLHATGASHFADGSVSARFAFQHALQASVVYERISPARRLRLHQRIGRRGEALYGSGAMQISAELANHFEHGRDFERALRYRILAAENDSRRNANREATAQLEHALALAPKLAPELRGDATIQALEALGLARRAMGDMEGSAAAFDALVDTARELGKVEARVHGLLYLASALYWIDRERCLVTVDRALEAAGQLEDAGLRARARGYCAHWNSNLRGFELQHVRASEEAVDAARKSGDPKVIALHVVRLAYARFLQSRYAEATALCDEGRAVALAAGDAYEWLLALFFRAWATLHSGAWSECAATLDEGLAMAEKNEHRSWAMLLRIVRAQLAAASCDFDAARRACEAVLAQAGSQTEGTGQVGFHGSIVLAQAQLGDGRAREARAALAQVDARLSARGSLMDWMLHLPLEAAHAECALAFDELELAAQHALRLATRAAQSGERTYLALAHELHARVAHARGAHEEVHEHLELACAILETERLPLAALRVLRSCVELDHQAAHRGSELATLVAELARELPDGPARARFEGHAAGRSVPRSRPARKR